MQVVILCGGRGTRIRDVADDVPKPMLRIGGQPILWHIMKGYARHGFKDFVLCLGYKSWAIKDYFINYRLASSDVTLRLGAHPELEVHGDQLEDWRVTLAETGLETMTGGRLRRAARHLRGETFLLTYGDGVSDIDVRALVRFHERERRLGTLTAVQPASRFGELDIDDSRVATFTEKPATAQGWINGGFFVFQRRFLDRLPDRDDLVLEQELGRLARDGELSAFVHDGFWHCMDSSRDYEHLNRLWATEAAPWNTWDAPRPSRLVA